MEAQAYTPPDVPGITYCINSNVRQFYTESPFDFTVSFVNGDVNSLPPGQYSVEVISAQFDNLIPNIHKYNNVFSIQYNNVIYTTTFATGNYNATTFLAAVNSFLSTVDVALTASYEPVSKLISLNIPAGSAFMFIRPIIGPSFIQNTHSYSVSANDRFMALLGFDPVEFGNIVFGSGAPTIITATWPLNLYGTSFVDITINTNLSCIHMGPKNFQILTRMPVTVEYGAVQFHEPQNPPVFMIDRDTLACMRITLYDSWTEIIDTVPKNTVFSLKLKLRAPSHD